MYHMYEKIYRKLKLRRVFKMDSITTFLKKGYDFFSKKGAIHIWILFGIGFFYKKQFPGIEKIVSWICKLIVKVIPLDIIEAVYQFLSEIYGEGFIQFTIIFAVISGLYLLVKAIINKFFSDGMSESILMQYFKSWIVRNIFTRIWCVLITRVWYIYKISELISSGDFRIAGFVDYLCLSWSLIIILITSAVSFTSD